MPQGAALRPQEGFSASYGASTENFLDSADNIHVDRRTFFSRAVNKSTEFTPYLIAAGALTLLGIGTYLITDYSMGVDISNRKVKYVLIAGALVGSGIIILGCIKKGAENIRNKNPADAEPISNSNDIHEILAEEIPSSIKGLN